MDLVELALEARVVLGPQRLEDPEHLVGLAAARVERGTQHLQLFLPPADADTDDQAALDSASMVVSILAMTIGWRWPRTNTEAPSRARFVHMAAAASVITGSR